VPLSWGRVVVGVSQDTDVQVQIGPDDDVSGEVGSGRNPSGRNGGGHSAGVGIGDGDPGVVGGDGDPGTGLDRAVLQGGSGMVRLQNLVGRSGLGQVRAPEGDGHHAEGKAWSASPRSRSAARTRAGGQSFPSLEGAKAGLDGGHAGDLLRVFDVSLRVPAANGFVGPCFSKIADELLPLVVHVVVAGRARRGLRELRSAGPRRINLLARARQASPVPGHFLTVFSELDLREQALQGQAGGLFLQFWFARLGSLPKLPFFRTRRSFADGFVSPGSATEVFIDRCLKFGQFLTVFSELDLREQAPDSLRSFPSLRSAGFEIGRVKPEVYSLQFWFARLGSLPKLPFFRTKALVRRRVRESRFGGGGV